MLGAGRDHIAVIDAAPLSTFHQRELHPAQPVSGNVVALVGLPRLLRVDELSASPRPATLKDSLAPQSTLTGNVTALVGLLRILRDSEQSVSPRPATHRDRLARRRAGRRRRSRPPKSVSRRQHQRRSTLSGGRAPSRPRTREAPGRARQISLHMERLAALRWRRRRLSRARRLAPAASASWAMADAEPPRDDARP